MTKVQWSDITKRQIQTGLDRGVFYPKNPKPGDLVVTNLATSPLPIAYMLSGDGAGYQANSDLVLAGQVSPSTRPSALDGPRENGRSLGYVRQTVTDSYETNNDPDRLSWFLTVADPNDAVLTAGAFAVNTVPTEIPESYRISFWWRSHSTNNTDPTVELEYSFYDVSGTQIGSLNLGPVTSITDNVWSRYSTTIAAPSAARHMALKVVSGGTFSTTDSQYGDTSDICALMITDITESSLVDELYFSGDDTPGSQYIFDWTSLRNTSTSEKRLNSNGAIAWDGLTNIDENGGESATTYYLDGRPYLTVSKPKEYSASIKAYTFPDEFLDVIGMPEVADGFVIDSQIGDMFGLSYRTSIFGLSGEPIGYKIHLVYNASVPPLAFASESLSDNINASDFTFEITAIPVKIPGYRSSAHFVIDTRNIDPGKLILIEALLYGTRNSSGYLPDPSVLLELLSFGDDIIITDNGDGTWTATGSRKNIYLIGEGIFQIDNANAIDNGDGTYTISST